MTMHHPNTSDRQTRLVTRIVRQLLHDEHFDTLADLTDALKFKCAQLKIRLTNDDITDAYRVLSSNTQLVPGLQRQRQLVERPPDARRYPTKAEAGALLRGLGVTLP